MEKYKYKMGKRKLCVSLLAACALMACTSTQENDGSISVVKDADNHEITVCDVSKVKDTLTIPLSEWVESCKLVRFENSDTALFKFWWPIITDNYIGIRPRKGNFSGKSSVHIVFKDFGTVEEISKIDYLVIFINRFTV